MSASFYLFSLNSSELLKNIGNLPALFTFYYESAEGKYLVSYNLVSLLVRCAHQQKRRDLEFPPKLIRNCRYVTPLIR
jgi:hypothetical protein